MTKQKIITTTLNQQILWSMMYLNTIADILKNVVLHSVAIAFAKSVFPVPEIEKKNTFKLKFQ
jgi:hypothetical protein